jgi:1-acyl-sn-glycerol-3-phosphate acyltransferase
MYEILRRIVFFIFKMAFNLKVEGIENLPKTNFIICANHTSFLDPFIIAASIPKRIYFLALGKFYKIFWIKWFLKIFNAIPVTPKGGTVQKAVYLLNKDKNIGIFPEGTRSFDGKLKEFKKGVAILGYKTGRPIVPCGIIGAYECLPRGAKFPKFSQIKLKIGKPIYLLKEPYEVIEEVKIQWGLLKLKNAISELVKSY